MYEEIIKYQKKEREIIAIEKELAASEERKRLVKARNFLTDVDKNVKEMDGKAEKLNSSFEKLVAKIKSLSAQVEEYNDLLDKSKSVEEANYFIKKVAKLDEELAAAEQSASKIINEVKQLLVAFEDYKKKVKFAKDQFEDGRRSFEALKNSRKAEVDKIRNELKAIEDSISPKGKVVFEEYKKVREKKIYPAIVPVHGNSCGGCRMELSMNKLSKLGGDAVIECEECGRIIYIP